MSQEIADMLGSRARRYAAEIAASGRSSRGMGAWGDQGTRVDPEGRVLDLVTGTTRENYQAQYGNAGYVAPTDGTGSIDYPGESGGFIYVTAPAVDSPPDPSYIPGPLWTPPPEYDNMPPSQSQAVSSGSGGTGSDGPLPSTDGGSGGSWSSGGSWTSEPNPVAPRTDSTDWNLSDIRSWVGGEVSAQPLSQKSCPPGWYINAEGTCTYQQPAAQPSSWQQPAASSPSGRQPSTTSVTPPMFTPASSIGGKPPSSKGPIALALGGLVAMLVFGTAVLLVGGR